IRGLHGRPVGRPDQACWRLSSLLPHPRHEGAQGAVHQPVALQDRWVQGSIEVRETVNAGKNDKQEAPRLVRGIEPGPRDGAIERRVRPEVMRSRSQHDPLEGTAMGAGAKAAGQRRADRDAVGDEIENRRRRYNVCVQPTTLDPAIAARGPPLRAPAASLRSAAPIEPTNPY